MCAPFAISGLRPTKANHRPSSKKAREGRRVG
jgi:hypothetical protein